MPKVFVIGRRDEILPFKAAGAEIIEAADATEAATGFKGIMYEAEPCLVMISEDLARGCAEEMAEFRAGGERAVVAIPTLASKPGATLAAVRARVARSIGVDLLGRKG